MASAEHDSQLPDHLTQLLQYSASLATSLEYFQASEVQAKWGATDSKHAAVAFADPSLACLRALRALFSSSQKVRIAFRLAQIVASVTAVLLRWPAIMQDLWQNAVHLRP